MGLKVSAREAALLAHRTERTIRAWVASGRLAAEPAGSRERRRGVGPSRWLIDTDELARMPGVTIDAARLAEIQAQEAFMGSGESVLERLATIERDVAELKRSLDELHQRGRGDARQPG